MGWFCEVKEIVKGLEREDIFKVKMSSDEDEEDLEDEEDIEDEEITVNDEDEILKDEEEELSKDQSSDARETHLID